jgi:fimbrial chaperone protein
MGKALYAGCAAAILACATMAPAHAYDMKPIIIQLAPKGAGASQSVVITNSHDVPIAIELRAYTRTQKPDGTEDRTPEDRDILITPPQTVIAPKTSQSVKVRWVGDPNPTRELSYRLVSEQLPIPFRQESRNGIAANVTMKYRYEAALYIVPPGSEPSAHITGTAAVKGEDGQTMLELRIKSDGTRRAILEPVSITLTPDAGGSPVTLTGDPLKPLEGLNILSGVERIVRLPWPKGLAPGPLHGTLDTKYVTFQ